MVGGIVGFRCWFFLVALPRRQFFRHDRNPDGKKQSRRPDLVAMKKLRAQGGEHVAKNKVLMLGISP
jgi:hypothetical protein